ncbi:LysR family transcriptional regulator ArgP [Nocardioides sp. Leaf307]|uniref:LysR family transcriptional regulator ArgP n=1 Tax=Nocardioides sp. Leaf307 TaxID=1736331 RepID=UPI000702D9E7|nr:LysR family transcriptional regulator ArgP [Nocardioides sp. Leaf307]KQQ39564.1 LysR family transcriptional regulator [Nocardioides sp. Leaf307]
MDLQPAQLAALVAIADTGSFEAAARALSVTPSAVSQRIRALESAAGQVLVRRTAPCAPTPAGERLVRLGRETSLLWAEAREELSASGAVVELRVAVNADSLATWFGGVLGAVGGWPGVALRLDVEDQATSTDLLRRGEALAAVTSDPVAVQGCTVGPLGVLRYRPAASPAFAERWVRAGRADWAAMPVVVFNEKDALQDDLLAARGHPRPPVVHRVPTSADFHQAVRRGLGWGLVPEPQLGPDLASGRLVLLAAGDRPGRDRVDVALHWQRWRLDSPLLGRLSDVVRSEAAAALRPLARPRHPL